MALLITQTSILLENRLTHKIYSFIQQTHSSQNNFLNEAFKDAVTCLTDQQDPALEELLREKFQGTSKDDFF